MAYFESFYNYTTRHGDVLDLLCLRIYRADGMIDAVLLANPMLLNHEEVFPAGVLIRFPKVPATAPAVKTNVVKLWG